MPSKNDHIQRARDNAEIAGTMRREDNAEVDWAVAMLFYSALHYVDAYLKSMGIKPMDHAERIDAIECSGLLLPIRSDYLKLKFFSEQSRYEIAGYDAEKHLDRLIRPYYDRIEAHMKSLLKLR